MKSVDVARLIEQVSGIAPTALNAGALDAALRRRLAASQVADLAQYGALLRDTPAEVQALIEEIIVPETWFFRQPQAFALLARQACAKLARVPAPARLRLLSLPCASGEEPYSMAMALLDAGLDASQFEIDALDISERSLARARLGVYGKNSFRGSSLHFRDAHFTVHEADFRLADAVRQPVRFARANLLDFESVPELASYDFVFCRNLLIYFDAAQQARAIRVLARLLRADSLLFVGPAEKSLFLAHDFSLLPEAASFALMKKAPSSEGACRATPRAKTVRRRRLPPLPQPLSRQHADMPADAAPVAAPSDGQGYESQWREMERLADQGQVHEAALRCEALLRASGPSAALLHWRGLLEDAQGRREQAEQFYRKALYLDPSHQDSLLHLAYLLEHTGRRDAARPLRQRLTRMGR